MPDRLLTVAEVAAWLALGQGWVREHAAELGAVRTGDDPRSPLRFARHDIEQWIDEHRLRPPVSLPTPRRRAAERVKLLPLPDERR